MKLALWSKVFKMNNKVFKKRKRDETRFTGMIRTDGVSVSVVMGPPTTKGRGVKRKIQTPISEDEYFQTVDPALFKENHVYIDPNKRDLLYCLGSNSQKIRYTQQERDHHRKTKKYRKIREACTTDKNMNSKPYDVPTSRETMDHDSFKIYLRHFFSDWGKREEFYKTTLFRKQKLNTYINTQRSESLFIQKFKKKYGENTTVFIGDWSSAGYTLPGQITTKGKGFRKMFRDHGYQVYLVDEYKTSKTCLDCNNEITTFHKRGSPKPWKRETIITVHGLLRCQSEFCQQKCGYKSRYWNRDDVATENIKKIVENSLISGERPQQFSRTIPIFVFLIRHLKKYAKDIVINW